jgi:hypothetical protein
MLPNNPIAPRSVRKYEVITPDGRVHQFPRPSWPRRLFGRLYPHADVVALSATIFALIMIAGFAAEALDRSMIDACNERPARPTGLS